LIGERRGAVRVWLAKLRKRDHLDLQEVGWEGTNCVDLAQNRDRWQSLVNAVMNLGVS